MILGVGIDSVDVIRFNHWHSFSKKTLQRIFSSEEIDYCFLLPARSAERFAVRFAMREAFFKAFSSAFPKNRIPFLTVCKQVIVRKTKQGVPYLVVDWEKLLMDKKNIITSIPANVSCSHTKKTATAIVILQADLY